LRHGCILTAETPSAQRERISLPVFAISPY
jgi:hypothetical protein